MKNRAKEKKVKAVPVGIGILVFLLAFLGGIASKFVITPSWAKEYSVRWSDEIGTLKTDLPYGDGEANKFDLYLPKDNAKESYGLVVYLHAGGFTSGDKSDDAEMLSWLCSKGYVACGINYTLRTESNNASVLTQSNEIKAAIPKVIEAAEAEGYSIDKLAMAGGSAGHTLAMLYAYRDAAEAPVPVVLTFGAVGPSCFHTEDWDNYGFDKNTEESLQRRGSLRHAEKIPVDLAVQRGQHMANDEHTSFLPVNVLCHAQRRPRLGPAGIEGKLGERFAHFRGGHAVCLGAFDVMQKRCVQYPAGHQRGHGDQAAVAGRELVFPRPDLSKQDIIVQLRKFGSKFAHGIPARRYFVHKNPSFPSTLF